ncbi:zinc finger protein 629-like [Nerophis ophidion]|uniref:zinc finger protein 629-like n=1 Tax=Nerophis ophidion TaxID=159077 RepID=UPI002ADF68D2|nr:zinc finger protein 629-like [Nerophis ophidion]
MDDYCYAKMATPCKKQHERELEPSRKSPTEIKTKPEDKDVQQLIGHPEKRLPQSGRSSTLKQETPQPPHIKKEEEELWITQEGECLLGPPEADLTKLPLTVVSVKTEDDKEKPQVDNLLAPLSDSEADDEVEVTLSSDTDCEDVHQLIGHSGELLPQTLKQETPQPSSIKKEEEELWITQEGECLLGREEADLTKFPLTVKTEDDEEKPRLDNLRKAEDEVEVPLSGNTDCEGDMRTHTHNKQFECSKNIRGKERFSCSVCAKSLTRKIDLTQHMRTHTGEKPFSCSVCGKSFSQKGNVTQHMKTHTGEKTCICSVCGKYFSQKSNLVQHMRTHTGEKPFSCSVCAKSFSQNNSLTLHMRTHTGTKPFTCSVCDRSFSQKSSLTLHIRTHTGKKPFKCSVCGKNFSQKIRLTQHMRTHKGEKPFVCSVCGKRFYHNVHAVRHIRTHTGE